MQKSFTWVCCEPCFYFKLAVMLIWAGLFRVGTFNSMVHCLPFFFLLQRHLCSAARPLLHKQSQKEESYPRGKSRNTRSLPLQSGHHWVVGERFTIVIMPSCEASLWDLRLMRGQSDLQAAHKQQLYCVCLCVLQCFSYCPCCKERKKLHQITEQISSLSTCFLSPRWFYSS